MILMILRLIPLVAIANNRIISIIGSLAGADKQGESLVLTLLV